MGRGVVLTDEAAQDLAEIRRWYSQPGAGEPAKRVLQRLEQARKT
jgi:plasmid stabilization system protein ParE